MNARPFRVLTIDGGGVRGLYTATVLRNLARWFAKRRGCGPLDVGAGFDLIAGTSTGGILACGLAAGVDVANIVDLYRVEGPKLFADPIPSGRFALGMWMARHLSTPANEAAVLRAALERIFGETTLATVWEARHVALCIPTVNARTHQPRVFKTPHDRSRQRDDDWRLVDTCLATSAAPIVLPLAVCADPEDRSIEHAFADGGLWANNPVLVGLVEALRVVERGRPIRVLSVGTCCPPVGRVVDRGRWGLAQWQVGITALEMSLDAQSAGHNHMAQFIARCLPDCAVTRLPDAPVSAQHSSVIGLDRASETALSALADLGDRAANDVMGEVTRATPLGQEVAEFFDALPERKKDGS